MAYVPGCRADVFISYDHDDNRDGWVTRLKQRLTEKLNPFLYHRAEVWFDDQIRVGDRFKDDIQERLKNTPILVAVLSPAYLESRWCIVNELEWFQNHGGKEIFQLVKVPLEDKRDAPVPDAHYELLYDASNGHPLGDEPLDKALDRVAQDLANCLRRLWSLRPRVYLAQLSDESTGHRWEELKQALHAGGYAILPKVVLRERGAEQRIRELLEDAGVSIHLGSVPEDSLARTQLQIARQAKTPAIILDRPPRGDEIAAVVADVQRKLEAGRRPAIYPIYDHHSDRWASALCALLEPLTGYQIVQPEAGETYHKYMLRVSEGIVLFRAAAPDAWLQSQKQVLLQAAALRGDRFVPEAWYFVRRPEDGPPAVHQSEGGRHECIIERTGEPTVDDLEPFVQMLRSRPKPAEGKIPGGSPRDGPPS